MKKGVDSTGENTDTFKLRLFIRQILSATVRTVVIFV